MKLRKKLIVIGGPTAAGKTALAVDLASHYRIPVLSADSRQFYKETTIGTAKPDKKQLESVRHHFIDCTSISEPYDVHRFEKEALELLKELHAKNDLALVVGGSGLYLEALIKGLDEMPGRDEAFRDALEDRIARDGLGPLQESLRQKDPATARSIDLQNPVRLIRALEIIHLTGRPASEVRMKSAAPRDFEPILIAVSPERDELYRRIDCRVDKMMEEGLLEEVRQLLPYRHLQALHTVGYSELFRFLDNELSLEQAVSLIKQHTRNYAKRQLTWFRNRAEYRWFLPEERQGILDLIDAA